MSQQRKILRDAWVEAIRSAKTIAGNNVVANRINKNWQEDLPAVNIYPISELTGEIIEDSPIRMRRHLQMVIECIVDDRNEREASDKLDLLMDQIEQAILERLSYDADFRCLADMVELSSVDLEFDEDGSRINAAGRQQWQIRYYTDVRDPAELDDLLTVNAEYSLQGPESDSENETDRFSVPTI